MIYIGNTFFVQVTAENGSVVLPSRSAPTD